MRLYKVAYYNLSGCHERPYGGLTIKFYPECLLFEDVRWSSDWDFAMVQSQPKLDWGHDPSHGRERRELLSCSWTRYTGKKYFETVSREATTRLETCLYDGKWVDMAETDSLTGNLCDVSSSKTCPKRLYSLDSLYDSGSCMRTFEQKARTGSFD